MCLMRIIYYIFGVCSGNVPIFCRYLIFLQFLNRAFSIICTIEDNVVSTNLLKWHECSAHKSLLQLVFWATFSMDKLGGLLYVQEIILDLKHPYFDKMSIKYFCIADTMNLTSILALVIIGEHKRLEAIIWHAFQMYIYLIKSGRVDIWLEWNKPIPFEPQCALEYIVFLNWRILTNVICKSYFEVSPSV